MFQYSYQISFVKFKKTPLQFSGITVRRQPHHIPKGTSRLHLLGICVHNSACGALVEEQGKPLGPLLTDVGPPQNRASDVSTLVIPVGGVMSLVKAL